MEQLGFVNPSEVGAAVGPSAGKSASMKADVTVNAFSVAMAKKTCITLPS